MAKKNTKTECSGIEWGQFLLLIDRLKRSKDYRFLLLISIGGYCGMRVGDMLRLKWDDVINRDEIILQEGKTGKHRTITLNQSLKDIVCYCETVHFDGGEIKLSDFIFCNRNDTPFSRQYVNRQLHRIFKECKIKVQNGSSHTLRKTFGRRVYEMNEHSEASLVLLSSIFNHTSIAITRKYIGLTQEKIQDVYINL